MVWSEPVAVFANRLFAFIIVVLSSDATFPRVLPYCHFLDFVPLLWQVSFMEKVKFRVLYSFNSSFLYLFSRSLV